MTKREECVEVMARAIRKARRRDIKAKWEVALLDNAPLDHDDILLATAALDAALRVLGEPDAEMVEAGCVAMHNAHAYDDAAVGMIRAMLATVGEK